jgi:hypothetical protein
LEEEEVTAAVDDLLRVLAIRGEPSLQVAENLFLCTYLVRRRALLDEYCPLRALVYAYDSLPTNTEDLWAAGLGMAIMM